MGSLKHILYSSVAINEFNQTELEALLAQSRENNAKLAITGLLLYRNGSFMQVLEGPENAVNDTYAIIKTDTRHREVFKLYDSPITKRDFPKWSMAFNSNEDEHIEGLSDFLHIYQSQDELQIPEGSVLQLLKRFRQINKR